MKEELTAYKFHVKVQKFLKAATTHQQHNNNNNNFKLLHRKINDINFV